MIDSHVHCRDGYQSHKETIAHARRVCERRGIHGIFDMAANSDPPVTTRDLFRLRVLVAEQHPSPVYHGVFLGLTYEPSQIEEAARCAEEYSFNNAVNNGKRSFAAGLKLFAGTTFSGSSFRKLNVTEVSQQRTVFETLLKIKYRGVVDVHCEKDFLMHSELWDSKNPITHSYARPEDCEISSIEDIAKIAHETGFEGRLHIVHVTTPVSVDIVDYYRKLISVSCAVTPWHLLLNNEMMNKHGGICLKVNPPLRSPETREKLLDCFKRNLIDILESDHAPHSYEEKTGGLNKDKKPQYFSGIPCLPWWQFLIGKLMEKGITKEQIERTTHDRVNEIFGTNIPRFDLRGGFIEGDDKDSYAFDPTKFLKD